MAFMTSDQLRRFNGLIGVLAAKRSRPGDLAPKHGNRILRELQAPDLSDCIERLEHLVGERSRDAA